jgi:hypothetical protein
VGESLLKARTIAISAAFFLIAVSGRSRAGEPPAFGAPDNGIEIGISAVVTQRVDVDWGFRATISIVTKNVGTSTLDLAPTADGAVAFLTGRSGKNQRCFEPAVGGSVGDPNWSAIATLGSSPVASPSPKPTPSPLPTPSPTPVPTPTPEHVLLAPGSESSDSVGMTVDCIAKAGTGRYALRVEAAIYPAGAVPGSSQKLASVTSNSINIDRR